MSTPRRNALTPEALLMMDTIARSGSFAMPPLKPHRGLPDAIARLLDSPR